ncbi:MAG: hypothetical protein JXA53_08275 [Bacteroidales bacterium]|nr:hypothetical protein [Bacteroidales bacterium]
MVKKYDNKYRIESTRFENWDYGCNGAYFITICTYKKQNYFGDIVDGKMNLSDIGNIAYKYWTEIPNHFPFVVLDRFVIMPNHIHGIIILNKDNSVIETRQCLVSTDITNNKTPSEKRFQNQGKGTISSIIGSYKSIVTKHVRLINPSFLWQSRFYDHVIRNNKSYLEIAEYIVLNPERWNKDCYHFK